MWFSNNLFGEFHFHFSQMLRSGRQLACCHLCVWASLYPNRSVVKGVKELILANGHLREVLEALITIVTVT